MTGEWIKCIARNQRACAPGRAQYSSNWAQCERVRTHGCPLLCAQMVSCQWEFLNWAKQNGQRMREAQQVAAAREHTKLELHANSPLARRTESHTFNWRHFTCSPACNVSKCRAEARTERFTTITSLAWARAGSISNRKQRTDHGCPILHNTGDIVPMPHNQLNKTKIEQTPASFLSAVTIIKV